ncbi:hypothetical protein BJH93_08245 [Kocuria polaris]|nr:hypothetical protein [Kocuria polaris]
MRISEVARETGIAPSAIRYYEQHDMFSPGQIGRLANGYRDYTPGALRRFELIQAGKDAGFSLAEIRIRLRDWDTMPDEERAQLLKAQLDVIDERIEGLTKSRATVQGTPATLRTR